MKRRRVRFGLLAFVLVGGVAAIVAFVIAPGGSSSDVSAPTAEQQAFLADYAKQVATDSDDATVSRATVVSTTYGAFTQRLDGVYGGQPVDPPGPGPSSVDYDPASAVFVVALRGNFTDNGASRPESGSPVPTGTQILAVLDTSPDFVLRDWLLLGTPLDVSGLGPVTTLDLPKN
jgi:hypothetical protein